MAARRTDGPRIDGILVIAKPAGPTSHDVVALVRRLTGVRRVGHGGTLDPFAMGVLPVFLGHATRMVEYHLGDAKAYRAAVVFGARSTTDDIDGQMTPSEGPPSEREAVEAALSAFRGPIDQVPPDHSAVHVAGRRAYQLARDGERPELAPRRVTIHGLDLVSWDTADPARPMAVLEVRCSAGTYVRSLARDLGERLGSGAYLGALTRTASGPFSLETAHPLDHVREELAAGRLEPLLLPIDAGLEAIPVVAITSRDRDAIARGQVVRLHAPLAGGPDAVGRTDAADGPDAHAPDAAAGLDAHAPDAHAPDAHAPDAAAGLDATAPDAAAAPDQGLLVRVIDEAGRLAAMAHVRAGRLYPDKVFVTSEP